ncbi:uncharacterized protein UTRI_05028 [Ustilago trichophora]|uniref:Uncharacterized protein n=1 Tax=Ustilago trichophora TaxID=86804 RepID=A0A5C3ECU7_9BASI|nr:uncharacterized protein UTRI_05028 [Ustilago trichophora]
MPPTSKNVLRRLDTLTKLRIDSYLASYPAALEAKASSSSSSSSSSKSGSETLFELDDWYQSLPFLTLPHTVQSNTVSTKPDLVKLMRWKLTREKHRPTLISLISSNSPSTCQEVLLRASKFLLTHIQSHSKDLSCWRGIPTEELLKMVEGTMKILAELKGVGPATSSAIVASWVPWGVFQSDELVLNLNEGGKGKGKGQGKIEYTWAFYKRFYVEAIEVVKKLTEDTKGLRSGKDVEKVAWSMFHSPSTQDSLEKVKGESPEDLTTGKVKDETATKKIREKEENLGQKELAKRKAPEPKTKAEATDGEMQGRRTSKRIRSKS